MEFDPEAPVAEQSDDPVPTDFLVAAPAAVQEDEPVSASTAEAEPGAAEPPGPSPDCSSSGDAQPAAATEPGASSLPVGDVLRQVLALPGGKRNCILALDADHLLVGVGPACMLLHLPSGTQKCLPARPGASVSSLALHPSGQFFAVGETRRSGTPGM
jgi:hypothetical protein